MLRLVYLREVHNPSRGLELARVLRHNPGVTLTVSITCTRKEYYCIIVPLSLHSFTLFTITISSDVNELSLNPEVFC